MYKETRETLLTVLLTAAIVGGGMYWFYNSNGERNVPETDEEEVVSENEVTLPRLSERTEGTVPTEALPVKEETTNEGVAEETRVPTNYTEKVFEPKNYTNEEVMYSIDFPKDWYWRHYGTQIWGYTDAAGNVYGADVLAFDTSSLPDTVQGEYIGKVVIMAAASKEITLNESNIADMKKWLNNVTVRVINREGPDITIVRGQMVDGLSMGATDVRMSAFTRKDNISYSISIAGPTPEEEKIFEQMVASFRFEERMP